ncbi:hypothetical protein GCM10022243_00300 [Saccharothrix violaceirubra]
MAALCAAVAAAGTWWAVRNAGGPDEGNVPGDETVVDRVVEGPLGEISATGPVSLVTPSTTQPPKTP